MLIKEDYIDWSISNLGPKVGYWYSPFLEHLGEYLKNFYDLNYENNFFIYNSFDSFKLIYKSITKESDETIQTIVQGTKKNYPIEFKERFDSFRFKVANFQHEQGIRNNPNNIGGIPQLGALLRSYLKFLYYFEHPDIEYPLKKNIGNINNQSEQNYWVYQPSDFSSDWKYFKENSFISLPWNYLNDLNNYETREDIQERIIEYHNQTYKPSNNYLAAWEFLHSMKIGDLVIVKKDSETIVAIGKIIGDYEFVENTPLYVHQRKIEWIKFGEWKLSYKFTGNILTNINKYPDLIENFHKLINENSEQQIIDRTISFKEWILKQKQTDGTTLSSDVVDTRIKSLIAMEKTFDFNIFDETNEAALESLKKTILKKIQEGNYDEYTAHNKIAFENYIEFVQSTSIVLGNDTYTKEDFLNEVFMTEDDLDGLEKLLRHKMNIIFKGAPGVGKTYVADRLAYVMMQEQDDSRIHFVQFHQNYSYEDFIEGYRPNEDGDGFRIVKGPFLKFCDKARNDSERPYFFIIDEINRGNMIKIFGELMMLIEEDKRDKSINLLYSNRSFSVPSNVYIIGTMNTADRSLAMIDYALRRRFAFYELKPAFELESFNNYIQTYENTELLQKFLEEIKYLNTAIQSSLGSGFEIGHSYFTDAAIQENTKERLSEILEYEIKPQLEEYWFDDLQRVNFTYDKLKGILYENNEYTH
nr:AAA family ATPase [Macrococcus goetzii]